MIDTELGGAERPVTIETLPDNVLLDTFEFNLGKDDPDEFDDDHNYDGWQTLVHVCRRWRCIVFASPHRLNLKIFCTRQRSINSKTVDIWPAFPIVISARDIRSKEDVTNVIAALRHHTRVYKIDYLSGPFQNSLLKEFAAIDEPFPALTCLEVFSFQQHNVPVLPDSFLGASAPDLRSLDLTGIPYPSVGKLLLSTSNLVHLYLWRIPHSGYISPETIVPCLSVLPRLESLVLGFQHPRSRVHRANRHPPPLIRVVFPNLTVLRFRGDIEYLEDILSHTEAPKLNGCDFQFFNQLVFNTPLIGSFIRHREPFMTIHRARTQFRGGDVQVMLLGREEKTNNNRKLLDLAIICTALDWQLSAVAQVLNSFLSCLPALETLDVVVSCENFQREVEVIQWREFFQPFTSVKTMTLESEDPVRLIAPALQEFARDRATHVLPALQNLFLTAYPSRSSGPPNEAIEEYIAARQFYGQAVAVHY